MKRSDIVQISDYEFHRLSFVDIGEKVRVTKGKLRGVVASISGYRQGWDHFSNNESDEEFSKSSIGDYVAAYLSLKDGNDSHLTVGLDEIEIISDQEFDNTLIVNKKNQILLL